MNERPNFFLYSLFAATIFALFAFGGYALLGGLNDDSDDTAARDVQVITDNDTTTDDPAVVTEGIDTGRGTIIDPPRALQDFTLLDDDNTPLSRSDLEGKYVLMVFGYTHCPDVCPANLLEFRRIKRDLGDLAENVTFLFISVDGERDTPELLNLYLQRYDPEFIGMSGTQEELDRIADDYGLEYSYVNAENSRAGYTVIHTASRFLIDPQGQLIRLYSFTTDATAITEDLISLIQ